MIKEFVVIRKLHKDGTISNIMLKKTFTEAINIVEATNKMFNETLVVGILQFENGKRI